MKARVNLTIDEKILESAKKYANEVGSSVSALVEDYLMNITKPKTKRSRLLKMVEKLNPSNYPENFNFKEEYYKAKVKKHGF